MTLSSSSPDPLEVARKSYAAYRTLLRSAKLNPSRRASLPVQDLVAVMARLRAPDGCPWDREQDHMSLRFHAVEEVYELMDAIEAGDEHEMAEELGDILLQVVFHCQLGSERRTFDFDLVCRKIVEKLIRRHPHVFAKADAKTVDAVWAQWEQIKRAEKKGTRHERASALDGVPSHLPALLRTEKLIKKARKAKLLPNSSPTRRTTKAGVARELFALAQYAQNKGWSAEALLRTETRKQERALRAREANQLRSKSNTENRKS